jgi:hypothetical protein
MPRSYEFLSTHWTLQRPSSESFENELGSAVVAEAYLAFRAVPAYALNAFAARVTGLR